MAYSEKLQKALSGIKASYGAGAVMNLHDEPQNVSVLCSTGSMTLDNAVGIGGYPEGRIIEIYGPESSGKTTLCLHALAEAQKKGYVVAMIDAENAYDPSYGEVIGVDHEKLIFSQPSSGEEALNIVDTLVASGEVGLIVVDSVAALVPQAELDGEIGDLKVGLHARLMSQAMRKLAGKCNNTGTVIIFVNQIREKIGVTWGSNETTTGGRALAFYASIRLDVRRIGKNESTEGGEKVFLSNLTKVKVVKNKVAPPFKEAFFDIVYGIGISRASELVSAALDLGILEKLGGGIFHTFETPIHPKGVCIDTTEAKAADILMTDSRFTTLEKEISLRVDVVTKKKTQEEFEELMKEDYEKATEKMSLYANYWDLGSKASSSSKYVEAFYYLTQSLEVNPFSKEAAVKLKAVNERIDKVKKTGKLQTDEEWIISLADGNKFNVLLGEIIE